jgi:hypothetical protein
MQGVQAQAVSGNSYFTTALQTAEKYKAPLLLTGVALGVLGMAIYNPQAFGQFSSQLSAFGSATKELALKAVCALEMADGTDAITEQFCKQYI